MIAHLFANMGAHRLAWWLAAERRRLAALRRRAALADGMVERLLIGAVVPDETVAVAIATATAGAVRPEDWAARGGLRHQRPADRPAPIKGQAL